MIKLKTIRAAAGAACLTAAMLMAACSADNGGDTVDSSLLRFRAATQQDLTRSTEAVEYVGPNFGLIGFAFDSWQQSLTPDYLYNVEVGLQGDYWTPVTPTYWPLTGSYARFYAYAPFGADRLVLSGAATQGPPTLTYTIADQLIDQKDLVLAASSDVACASHPQVSLVFNHLLTGVKFAEGRIRSGLVTRIAIRGVRNKGVYKTALRQWESQNGRADYEQPVSYTTGTAGSDIMADKAFLLMPQNVPAGAKVEVTIQGVDAQTGQQHTYTLTATIGGQVWNPGSWLSYRINADAVVIYQVNAEPVIVPWDNVTEEIKYFFVQGSPWINSWNSGYTNSEAVDYNIVTGQPTINSWGGSEDDNNIDYRLIGGAASIRAWEEARRTGIDYNFIIARHLIHGWNTGHDGMGGDVDYNTITGNPGLNSWNAAGGSSDIDYNTVTGGTGINSWQPGRTEDVNM